MCAPPRASSRRFMASPTLTGNADLAVPAAATKGKKPRKALDLKYQPGFGTIAFLCVAMLYAPIAVLTVFSFNAGNLVTRWGGFGFHWYDTAIHNEGFHHAAANSLSIAFTATIV